MPCSPPTQPRLSIAVVGLGGIGGALAMSLRAADRHDVAACARRPIGRMVLERAEGIVDLPLRAVNRRGAGDAGRLGHAVHQGAPHAIHGALAGPSVRAARPGSRCCRTASITPGGSRLTPAAPPSSRPSFTITASGSRTIGSGCGMSSITTSSPPDDDSRPRVRAGARWHEPEASC